ncbi:MAG: hopanoid biosynthesis-associated protein HpnK [Pseudomonadota bacterium]|nr:hopanoid biosynthesis-associated protein HpnK [Pseudomonadota bacterium]
MNRLVVTADDFGLAREVNEAVELAHTSGILSAASLMVASPASADAVRRAKALPNLRVGLHVVLVEARPALPAEQIPDLVGRDGMLRSDMARLALDIVLRPRVRAQVAAEIEAQFQAYSATGLALDHVDAHRHFHLHPLIASDIIAIGRRYGLRALRVPHEPPAILRKVEAGAKARMPFLAPVTTLLRAKARRAALTAPDAVFGLAWSGAMTAKRLAGLLGHLPPGLVEVYTHPATANEFAGHAPGYRYTDELAALRDEASVEALRVSGYRLGGFGDAL